MKQQIYKLHPELEHTEDTEDICEYLIEAAKAQHAIEDYILIKLSDTMPHCVKVVIEEDPWYTKILGYSSN